MNRCSPEEQKKRDLLCAAVGAGAGFFIGQRLTRLHPALSILGGAFAGIWYATLDNASSCAPLAQKADEP